MNTKENIRKSVASRFENFTEQERQLQSKKICEKIQSHPEFLHRETVVIYQPFPDEPDLQYLDFSDKHVIRAPQGSDSPLLEGTPSSALVIVPGRAFTLDGKRIGRGGGWYDRLLSSSPDLYKMGVCFDFQVFDDLPIEEHDVVMDEVIST